MHKEEQLLLTAIAVATALVAGLIYLRVIDSWWWLAAPPFLVTVLWFLPDFLRGLRGDDLDRRDSPPFDKPRRRARLLKVAIGGAAALLLALVFRELLFG